MAGSVLFCLLYGCCSAQAAAVPAAKGDDSLMVPEAEQVRLSEILIRTPQPYSPSQIAEARRRADEVRDAIRRGRSFAEIARAGSQGPTAAQGGDLGCFAHGQLGRALDELAFRMKVGDVSDVIRTKQGFVLLPVSSRGAHPCAVAAKPGRPSQTLTEEGGGPWAAPFFPGYRSSNLDLSQPTVDVDLHPRDVRRVLRGQKCDGGSHFLGLSKSLHRNLRNDFFREFIDGLLG